MSSPRTSLRSGELARLTGVSPDTVRYYERLGILPQSPRSVAGYRMYPPDAVDRVLLVQRASQLGFTLKELSEILRVRDRGGVPCQRVLHLTEQKLRSLAQQIQQLRRTQHYMRQLVRQWRKQLAQAPPGSKAMLLHSLADKPRSEFKVDPFRRTTKTMKNLSMMATVLLCMFVASLQAQDTKEGAMNTCPMHQQHASANSHHAAVEKNGDQAMGFPHDKTTHHFRLAANGGVIEVTVDDPSDASNTEAIRSHLSHIAILFGNGDFTTPMFVHDGVPPGVTIMQLVKGAIRYRYEEVPSGGRVRVESGDPVAIAAIHDFIRFQITEHQTGDDLGVTAAH